MWKELDELDVILVKLEPYQREKLIENLKANKELYESVKEDLRAANEKISRMGFYDQLTNIPNRKYFEDHFERILAQAQRDKIKFALLYLDLDGLKSINDNFGHRAGDLVLKTVANRFEPQLFPS